VKTLRWTLRVVLALVFLVVTLVLLLLYSPGFLHFAIDIGLGFYNDRIPGEIKVGRVEGRLIDHLVLGDIYLADEDGRALVVARELSLTWDPWELLHGGVSVSSLEVSDVQVHLVPGGFGDLAPPGPEKPPRETIAPDLPIDLWVGALRVKNVDLLRADGTAIVSDLRLAARDIDWAGLRAHLKIDDAAAQLPGVTLEALALDANYAEPRLELTGLVTTNLAIAELVRVDLDASDLTGAALLAVDGRRAAIADLLTGVPAERLREAPGDPSVRIDARGDAGHLDVGLHVEVPGLADLDLAAAGNVFGAPHLALRGRAMADLERLLGPPHGEKFGQVRPVFEARLDGPDWSQLHADVTIACGECGALSGLKLRALATRDAVLGAASAFVDLVGAGALLRAEVRAGPRGLEAARWDLRVPDIAVPLGVARLFAPLPPLDGAVASRGSCTGAPLRCEGALEVDRFAGYKVQLGQLRTRLYGEPLRAVPELHAELSARDLRVPGYRFAGAEVVADVGANVAEEPGALEVRADVEVWVAHRDRGDRVRTRARVLPGPPLVIFLEALDARLRGLRALLPRPARIEIAGRRFDVDGLGLLAAGGRIAVDGRADLDGRSDLRVAIERVQLEPLVALVPALRGQLRGSLTAKASLQGPATDPELSLALGGQKLRFRDGALGDLDVAVDVGHGRGRVAVGLVGSLAERVAIGAEVPLTADLSRGQFAVKHGNIHLGVDIKRFRLGGLKPWLGEGWTPRGFVDVQAAIDGPSARPSTTLTVRGRDLVYSTKEPPGSLDLVLTQKAGEDATLRLDAQRLGGRMRLNVTELPARLDLVDGGVKWHPERRHAATIVVRDVDLWRQLSPIFPGNDYSGRIELVGTIDGPMTAPQLSLNLRGESLRVRDAHIGRLRADVRHADDQLTVDVGVQGDFTKATKIHAVVPLRLAPARGQFTWLKDQPHELKAEIREFELAGLKGLGVTAKMEGRVDVDAALTGPMSDPQLQLGTHLRGFVWKTRPVGNVHASLTYRGKRAELALRSTIGRGTVDARASVPIDADLGRGKFKWDERAQNEVELRVDGLDRTMLAPLGRVPEEALIELSMVARAKGNLQDFTASLEAHGQMGHKLIGGAPVHITADIKPNSQKLLYSLGPHKWAGEIEIRADAKADIFALARGKAKAGDIPFTATMRADKFDSRFAQAFVPRNLYDLNGVLNARVDAKGTVGAPDVDGELHLRRGSITVLELQQRIRKIELDVRAHGRRIVVEKLTAESGQGRLNATATVDLPRGGGLKVASDLQLRRFPLVRPGLPQMQIDTRVKTSVVSTAEETDVNLDVSGTKVYVTGYTVDPPKQIPENANVIYKDQQVLVGVATDAGPDGEVTAENEERKPDGDAAKAAGKRFAMKIKLTDPIDIRGPATEMRWTGAVSATREGLAREVSGKLTAKDGRLDLLGNSFKIESGEVTLPEEEDTVDPYLYVVARTSTSAGIDVTATFKGRLTRPELEFKSEPAMSQSQILTLLLTGSPDASEADEQRVLAQAAALLATFQNPALSSFLSSRLGIDRVGLSFGDDVNQPILSVGKRLTKRIYVETAFKYNAPRGRNRVEARVEYEFAPRWTIETFFGDAAVGGVDVFWHKIFGQPKRAQGNTGPAPKGTGAGTRGTGGGDATSAGGSSGGGGGSGGR